jgi:mannosyltransferase OCH1-like enzyme
MENQNQSSIPHVLHQIWWQGEGAIPQIYQDFRQSFLRNNPAWTMMLWGEADILRLVQDKYPALKSVLRHDCHRIVEKVDVAKVAVPPLY